MTPCSGSGASHRSGLCRFPLWRPRVRSVTSQSDCGRLRCHVMVCSSASPLRHSTRRSSRRVPSAGRVNERSPSNRAGSRTHRVRVRPDRRCVRRATRGARERWRCLESAGWRRLVATVCAVNRSRERGPGGRRGEARRRFRVGFGTPGAMVSVMCAPKQERAFDESDQTRRRRCWPSRRTATPWCEWPLETRVFSRPLTVLDRLSGRAAAAPVLPRLRRSVAESSACRSSDGFRRGRRPHIRESTQTASSATCSTVGAHPREWRAARCGSRARSPRE